MAHTSPKRSSSGSQEVVLPAEIVARFHLEPRHLKGKDLVVLVHAPEPVGQPAGAGFEKDHLQLRKPIPFANQLRLASICSRMKQCRWKTTGGKRSAPAVGDRRLSLREASAERPAPESLHRAGRNRDHRWFCPSPGSVARIALILSEKSPGASWMPLEHLEPESHPRP